VGSHGVKMSKFFVNAGNIGDGAISITGEDVNHIKNVLRLKTGDKLLLCDGRGTDYEVVVEEFAHGLIRTSIVASYAGTTEPPIEVTLFQGIPKLDKMDYIVQKCVELGVGKIVPVINDRTVVRMDAGADVLKKVSRWRKIAAEAAKQCNRGIIPGVEQPQGFKEALRLAGDAEIGIILYENEKENGIRSCISGREIKKIALFIGPEGGYSENEIKNAVSSGMKTVKLGPRILRTETAGIAAISILMYEKGDAG